ncbi:MAG: FAD-dependent oxidoreductase [Candidatus Fermentibacter sp.]|nr:FAD-dependent oxidoreductase [Candidatus Fermentibacter sp.]
MTGTDVLVIGGGHAGAEAALAAARMGARTAMVTMNAARIGMLSCNPSVGGVAKGTMVREIDALGGVMGEAADFASIQFRMLNRSRGPAVWGPRVQCDGSAYSSFVRGALRSSGVEVVEGEVEQFRWAGDRAMSAVLSAGGAICFRTAVVAAGTFLGAVLFRGRERWSGGRAGDKASDRLCAHLSGRGFHVERFKTGTPPRLLAGSIDYGALEQQSEEGASWRFSSRGGARFSDTRAVCFTTRAGCRAIDTARSGMGGSPLFDGSIGGRGPRYCPSFEDKAARFPDRLEHPVFLEPMGMDGRLVYAGGMSTSLPRSTQIEMIRSLPGCGRAVVASWGYAVEYGYFPGECIGRDLRLVGTDNVFLAGQVCGTSGYEEAAGLGLVAGACAALSSAGDGGRFRPQGSESFIGVMLEDIAGSNLEEPYRLFSSRASNRLHLRQDNAEARLLAQAVSSGLSRPGDEARLRRMERQLEEARTVLNTERAGGRLLADMCRVTEFDVESLGAMSGRLGALDPGVVFTAALDERYMGHVRRAEGRLREVERMSSVDLSCVEDFSCMEGISWESRERLQKARPANMGEAALIPGMRPSDVEGLLIGVLRMVPRGTKTGV